MNNPVLPPRWLRPATDALKALERLLKKEDGTLNEAVYRQIKYHAEHLKGKYKEDGCYEYLMWRVINLEDPDYARNPCDIPTAYDFPDGDSVTSFIKSLQTTEKLFRFKKAEAVST